MSTFQLESVLYLSSPIIAIYASQRDAFDALPHNVGEVTSPKHGLLSPHRHVNSATVRHIQLAPLLLKRRRMFSSCISASRAALALQPYSTMTDVGL